MPKYFSDSATCVIFVSPWPDGATDISADDFREFKTVAELQQYLPARAIPLSPGWDAENIPIRDFISSAIVDTKGNLHRLELETVAGDALLSDNRDDGHLLLDGNE